MSLTQRISKLEKKVASRVRTGLLNAQSLYQPSEEDLAEAMAILLSVGRCELSQEEKLGQSVLNTVSLLKPKRVSGKISYLSVYQLCYNRRYHREEVVRKIQLLKFSQSPDAFRYPSQAIIGNSQVD